MVQSPPSVRMPGGLKGALVAVWLQAAVNLVVAIVMFGMNRSDSDHGYTDDRALLLVAAWATLVAAVLLAAGALGTAARRDWARRTVIGLELLSILSGVVLTLLGGATQGLLGMVVAAAVIGGFSSTRAIGWVRGR
ncbi:hypothetical protein CFP65_5539 [Kitasatospora sp. MMS16-BH015]|nr:hypothetical protein CFP65_5539 [Kitasatospora sp. MMS16-BH015]